MEPLEARAKLRREVSREVAHMKFSDPTAKTDFISLVTQELEKSSYRDTEEVVRAFASARPSYFVHPIGLLRGPGVVSAEKTQDSVVEQEQPQQRSFAAVDKLGPNSTREEFDAAEKEIADALIEWRTTTSLKPAVRGRY